MIAYINGKCCSQLCAQIKGMLCQCWSKECIYTAVNDYSGLQLLTQDITAATSISFSLHFLVQNKWRKSLNKTCLNLSGA